MHGIIRQTAEIPRAPCWRALASLTAWLTPLLPLALLAGCAAPHATTAGHSNPAQSLPAPATVFEPNRGQAPAGVRYIARHGNRTFLLTGAELLVPSGAGDAVRIRFAGAGQADAGEGEGIRQLTGISNYLQGDAAHWIRNVPHYTGLQYRDVFPGIDISFYGKDDTIAFDYIVEPGGDAAAIRLAFSGIDHLDIEQDRLVATHPQGRLVLAPPVIYQQQESRRVPVAGRYVLRGPAEAGFEITGHDRTVPLVIDPVITWSGPAGGSDNDQAYAIARDGSGNLYVAGTTSSPDLPLSGPYQATLGGFSSAFVMKFDAATHDLVYSTYLGDNVQETRAITVDTNGNATVSGSTASTTWPVVNPLQAANAGLVDAFVTTLNAAGNGLLFSTYLGGSGIDRVRAMAVDASGRLYLTGPTSSPDFPLHNASQSTLGGFVDTWIARLDTGRTQTEYATFLGGSGNDYGAGIAADSAGNAYVTGFTSSQDFPLAAPLQGTSGGGNDAYIVRLDGVGALAWSTYFGGSGTDNGNALLLSPSGDVLVAGQSNSTDLPVVNALQGSNAGGIDAFLARFDATGTTLVSATYLGGSAGDAANALGVDAHGDIYLAGTTSSGDFPRLRAVQTACGGGSADAFVTRIDPAANTLRYSTCLGGTGEDRGQAVVAAPNGDVWITGLTRSVDFPLADPWQPANAGQADIYITGLAADNDDDTIPDSADNCPAIANPGQADLDLDGQGDACDNDIDGDGLDNSAEVAAGSDPYNPDTDGDSLSDGAEVNTYGTSPLLADTDGDSFSDAVEIGYGSDPLLASSFPPPDGDLDLDGVLTAADLLAGYGILAGTAAPTGVQLLHGDVAPLLNGVSAPDGRIDVGDMLLILRKLLGLADFP